VQAALDAVPANNAIPTVIELASGTYREVWEHGSKSPSGRAIDVSQRHPVSTQIGADQAAMMRDPALVLGGWQPPLR
jgi:pectin methylesterase-like acyl-CoA thioesterase